MSDEMLAGKTVPLADYLRDITRLAEVANDERDRAEAAEAERDAALDQWHETLEAKLAAEGEQRDAREIIAGALKTPYYSRKPHATPEEIAHERADDALAALADAGLSVVRLELACWLSEGHPDGEDQVHAEQVKPSDVPLYRVGVDIDRLVSMYPPQPREASKPARSVPDATTEEPQR